MPQRRYWIVSPNVEHDGKRGWKQIILKDRVAIMGWGPDDYRKSHSRGPQFAGRGSPSVQQGDIILVARRHKANKPDGMELVALGVVNSEYWMDTFPYLHANPVQLRALDPFKPLEKAPRHIPVNKALPWQSALEEIDPQIHKKVCDWLEKELENAKILAEGRRRTKYASVREGPDHKKLKEWCASNPQELGLTGVTSVPGRTEFHVCEHTGDLADVVFHMQQGRYAVIEVETSDAKPGAYQVLKYKTLLCAREGYPITSDKVRAILVAWEIPAEVHAFCEKYGIIPLKKKL